MRKVFYRVVSLLILNCFMASPLYAAGLSKDMLSPLIKLGDIDLQALFNEDVANLPPRITRLWNISMPSSSDVSVQQQFFVDAVIGVERELSKDELLRAIKNGQIKIGIRLLTGKGYIDHSFDSTAVVGSLENINIHSMWQDNVLVWSEDLGEYANQTGNKFSLSIPVIARTVQDLNFSLYFYATDERFDKQLFYYMPESSITVKVKEAARLTKEQLEEIKQHYIAKIESRQKTRIDELKQLIELAYIRGEKEAQDVLEDIAQDKSVEIRSAFIKDLQQSNPFLLKGQKLWNIIASDKAKESWLTFKETEKILRNKGQVLNGIVHHLRNKLVSIGGFARRLVKKWPVNDKDRQYIPIAIMISEKVAKLEEMIKNMVGQEQLSNNMMINKVANEVTPFLEEIAKLTSFLRNLDLKDQSLVQYLEAIQEDCQTLITIANNMKRATTIKDLEFEKSNLNKLLNRAKERFIAENPDMNVEIIASEANIKAIVDDDFENIMLEMFKNAKEEDAKNITVTLRKGYEKVMLKISDDGIGLSEKDLPNIFDPFVQSKKAAYTTSLSLYYIRNILFATQGSISAYKGTKGKGLGFLIQLPLIEGYAVVNRIIDKFNTSLAAAIEHIERIKGKAEWQDLSPEQHMIINNYQDFALKFLSRTKPYLKAEDGFQDIVDLIRKEGAGFLLAFEMIEELSVSEAERLEDASGIDVRELLKRDFLRQEWEGMIEILKEKAMISAGLLTDIMISSYRSTEKFSAEQTIEEVTADYLEQMKTRYPQQGFNMEKSIDYALESADNRISTYKLDFEALLFEFLDSVVKAGARNIKINAGFRNRKLYLTMTVPTGEMSEFASDGCCAYNISVIHEIEERTGGKVHIFRNAEKGLMVLSFSLPVTCSLKTSPVDSTLQKALDKIGPVAIVISGLRGARRNDVAHYLESKLALKRINAGFWLRVLMYYLINERKSDYERVDKLINKLAQLKALGPEYNQKLINQTEDSIKKIIKDIYVPYIQEFFKKNRIDFLADPVTIDGEDTAAYGEINSLRNRIKSTFSKPQYRKFFYTVTNDSSIQHVVDNYVIQVAKEISGSGRYNGVTIIATDPKQQPKKGMIEYINFYLNAPAEERAKNLLFLDYHDLTELDKFTGKDELPFDEIKKIAEILNIAEDYQMKTEAVSSYIINHIKALSVAAALKKQEIQSKAHFELVQSAI